MIDNNTKIDGGVCTWGIVNCLLSSSRHDKYLIIAIDKRDKNKHKQSQ